VVAVVMVVALSPHNAHARLREGDVTILLLSSLASDTLLERD